MSYSLSCHCNAIQLDVEAELDDLLQCNCSSCRRFGAIHWYVPADAVTLKTKSVGMSTYAWTAVNEGHHFCKTCGTSIMRTGYPNGVVAINAACINEVDIFELEFKQWDGRSKMPPGVQR